METKLKKVLIGSLVLAVAFLFNSCSEDKDEPIVATSLTLVSGGNQTAFTGTVLTEAIKVIVNDQNGKPFEGTEVRFSVTEGAISSTRVETSADGSASVSWTLGASVGVQTLTVTALKADGTTLKGSPISVTAIANAQPAVASRITLVGGANQSAIAGSGLPNTIDVLVSDQDGNPFEGAAVRFSVVEGNISATSVITDVTGKASVSWTLGNRVGVQQLTISAFMADGTTPLLGAPLRVSATASAAPPEATQLTLVSGNNQTAVLGTELAEAIVVKVVDQYGNAFEGTTVHVTPSGGTTPAPTFTTDVKGEVSIRWVLGNNVGVQNLSITAFKANGTTILTGAPITVEAVSTFPPAEAESIELVSGAGQSAVPESELINSIEVLVKDQYGQPYRDATVQFSVAEGRLSSTMLLTDHEGKASVRWILGTTKGAQSLTVTAFKTDGVTPLAGAPISVSATARDVRVGDFYKGGIVFYVDASGNHGLVCAVENQGTAPWGCVTTEIAGADGLTIGTGAQNTIDIENGCAENGTAADICANLNLEGYSDWFLPSKEALEAIADHLTIIKQTANALGGDGFEVDDFYWSSSEYSTTKAWMVEPALKRKIRMTKHEDFMRVLPVRAF